jgi:hypothetical protein
VLSLIGFGQLEMSLSLITKFIPVAASFGKWRVNLVNEIRVTMVECTPISPELAVHKVNQFFGRRPALDGMIKKKKKIAILLCLVRSFGSMWRHC